MKNNKGFALTEILVLSTIVIGVLTFMYIQFKNINRSYQTSFNYDTVEGMYLANNILNYINEDNYDTLVGKLNNQSEGYIDITNCDLELFQTPLFCEQLIQKSKIKQIIFTNENTSKLKANMQKLDNDFQEYIKKIKTINTENDYRIIIKYNDNTFASLRFNKGNAYVQNGLIAYLDGINNTGNGHSNEIQTWKDLSNHGNDATLYNNPVWSNNSLILDGLTNFAKLENTANMAFETGFTWEIRVKILSLTGVKANGNMNIFGNWNSGGGGIYFNDSNKLLANVRTNGTYIVNTNETSNIIDEYYTVAITYDYNNLNLYINGQIISSIPNSESYDVSILPLTIGGEPDLNTNILKNYSNTEFQNILIYDRALTENEVARNYQADMARY